MWEQKKLCVIDDNKMAIVLLQILHSKKIINQPTFEKISKKYKERLKEVA